MDVSQTAASVYERRHTAHSTETLTYINCYRHLAEYRDRHTIHRTFRHVVFAAYSHEPLQLMLISMIITFKYAGCVRLQRVVTGRFSDLSMASAPLHQRA